MTSFYLLKNRQILRYKWKGGKNKILKWQGKCKKSSINKISTEARNKMLLVRSVMSACLEEMWKCYNAAISIIKNACANHLKSVLAATPSLFDARMMNARNRSHRGISATSSINNYTRNIKAIPSKHTLMSTAIQFLGALLLIAAICSFTRKEIKRDSSVYNVKNSIAWIVELIGTKEWAVKNIRLPIQSVKMMKNSSISWKGKSSNNALSANFGCKRMKDAIIWPVNANFNFATNVEEFTWNVNVYKKLVRICKPEEEKPKKECEERSKERMNC